MRFEGDVLLLKGDVVDACIEAYVGAGGSGVADESVGECGAVHEVADGSVRVGVGDFSEMGVAEGHGFDFHSVDVLRRQADFCQDGQALGADPPRSPARRERFGGDFVGVDEADRSPGLGQRGGSGRTGRAGAENENVEDVSGGDWEWHSVQFFGESPTLAGVRAG